MLISYISCDFCKYPIGLNGAIIGLTNQLKAKEIDGVKQKMIKREIVKGTKGGYYV